MAKKQALGKGLGAILPIHSQDPSEESRVESNIYQFDERVRAQRVAEIDVEQIRPNPYQPRETFEEEALSELAASIAEHGLIQPISVRVVGPKQYEIISGERRYRASKLAGLDTVPAYIREADDEEMLEWSLVENIQREDLDPIEEAMGFQRLMDECDLTQAQVAVKVGKDRSTIANALRLLRLPAAIQKLLREGRLSAGHARVLVSVTDAELQEALAGQIVDQGLSVRATEEFVRDASDEKPAKPKPKTPKSSLSETEAAQIRDLTNRLRSHFGTQIAIKHESDKGGRIEIAYYSAEDLERLIELLLGLE